MNKDKDFITTKRGARIGLHSYASYSSQTVTIDNRGEEARRLRVGSEIVINSRFVKLTRRCDNGRDPAWRTYEWEQTSGEAKDLIPVIANAVGGLKPEQMHRLRAVLHRYL